MRLPSRYNWTRLRTTSWMYCPIVRRQRQLFRERPPYTVCVQTWLPGRSVPQRLQQSHERLVCMGRSSLHHLRWQKVQLPGHMPICLHRNLSWCAAEHNPSIRCHRYQQGTRTKLAVQFYYPYLKQWNKNVISAYRASSKQKSWFTINPSHCNKRAHSFSTESERICLSIGQIKLIHWSQSNQAVETVSCLRQSSIWR